MAAESMIYSKWTKYELGHCALERDGVAFYVIQNGKEIPPPGLNLSRFVVVLLRPGEIQEDVLLLVAHYISLGVVRKFPMECKGKKEKVDLEETALKELRGRITQTLYIDEMGFFAAIATCIGKQEGASREEILAHFR